MGTSNSGLTLGRRQPWKSCELWLKLKKQRWDDVARCEALRKEIHQVF